MLALTENEALVVVLFLRSSESTTDATYAGSIPTILFVVASRRMTLADVRVDHTTRTEVDEILAALTVA